MGSPGRLSTINTTVVDPVMGDPVGDPVEQKLWVDTLGDPAGSDPIHQIDPLGLPTVTAE
ncbi:hypothetical protein ACT3UD_17505 [Glutamicibacter sp. 287]|uniref:hypothetical protein n=1 Tax=unclassified Glutamicibacter TaxID=2627139 RepID=UPI004034D936